MTSEEFSIIPAPLQIRRLTGEFLLTRGSKILVDPENEPLAAMGKDLADKLSKVTGLDLTWDISSVQQAPRGTIFLTTQTAGGSPSSGEGYTLEVLPRAVTLSAGTASGTLYGLQTLRQLFPAEIEGDKLVEDFSGWSLPAVRIVDKPRFPWRGLLLDCCRHFLSKHFVLRIIDLLAYHKMNVLHWHLTDDQGWRLEIKKYPKLIETGAYRVDYDGARYGGFYTQDEIREVVTYAGALGVTVLPEIEMPGHCVAALASYPKFSCTGSTIPVATKWGVFEDVFCAGNEQTYEFIGDVLAEVTDLFSSEYIHVGGDECPHARWEACNQCKTRMGDEGLKSSEELQAYFTSRVAQILEKRGRKLIGWDEILSEGLSTSAAVQAWRGMDRAAAAARTGHNVICSPASHTYFDQDLEDIDLAKAYAFEPVPADLPPAAHARILGGECALWTENAPRHLVDKKLFPRMVAFAERLWSPPDRHSFEDFRRRLQNHYRRLELLGVEYGPETE